METSGDTQPAIAEPELDPYEILIRRASRSASNWGIVRDLGILMLSFGIGAGAVFYMLEEKQAKALQEERGQISRLLIECESFQDPEGIRQCVKRVRRMINKPITQSEVSSNEAKQ